MRYVVVSKLILSIAIPFLFYSCNKSHPIPGVDLDTTVELWIRNKDGKNLLDSTTKGYYNVKDIKVFYVINGQKVEVFNPNLDAPRNFFTFKYEANGESVLRIFLYPGTTNQEITTTYLQWRGNEVDTLKGLINRPYSNVTKCDKVWYNGKVTFDYATTGTYFVTWDGGYFIRLTTIIK